MKKCVLLAAMLATVGFAANANEINYTYVEGGYAKLHIDDEFLGNPEGDGGYLRGSVAIAPQAYVFGSYGQVSDDFRDGDATLDVSIDQAELGFGYHMAFSDRVDFTADIAYLRQELTLKLSGLGADYDGKVSEDAKGGKVSVGLRGMPSARTEAWVKAGYIDGGDFEGDFVGTLGGQVKFNPTWGLVAEVEMIEDFTRYLVGVRASF
ncbi:MULTISPECIES: hypothetical protein [unclassified Lysobacter]